MTRDTFDQFQPPERGLFGDNESAPPVNDPRLVDIVMVMHSDAERPRAILASTDGNRLSAVWLPKSEVEIVQTGPSQRKKNRRFVTPVRVTMPQWLAQQKGLI